MSEHAAIGDYCKLVLACIAAVVGLVVVISNIATQILGHGFVGLDGLPLVARWGAAAAFGAYAEAILSRSRRNLGRNVTPLRPVRDATRPQTG